MSTINRVYEGCWHGSARSRSQFYQIIEKLIGTPPKSEHTRIGLEHPDTPVGLSPSKVKAAIGETATKPKPLPPYVIWVTFLIALVLGIILAAAWINIVRYSTYIPGIRY